MKRFVGAAVAAMVLVIAAALSMNRTTADTSAQGDIKVDIEERNPWTHLKFNNNPRDFRFAVVSDRTGGHRAKIFSTAIERLNLMQPEFVVSVGDLIEGYTDDKEKLDAQWKEFNGFVKKLDMPFFYVPGNHDVTNPTQEKEWARTLGRRYYHFVYRDVLFLNLDTEDPPPASSKDEKTHVRISEEQIRYVKKTLETNKDVRWTLVFLHKPLWIMAAAEKSRFDEVEKLLDGRKYSVFAGHVHRYQKFVRQGMNYYMLATTGGGSKLRGLRYGEFDHITWVTFKKDAPVVANVLLDGILSDNLAGIDSDEPGVPTKNRKPVHPVEVKVEHKGKPLSNAVVVFHSYNEKTKKYARTSDAMTESDGRSPASTYTAFDGVPVGEYTVTVTWGESRYDETGKPTPNRLPEKYARPEQSPLRAVVKEGKNQFSFEIE